MRQRRNTRARRDSKFIITNKLFFTIVAVLIGIIVLSILTIMYRQDQAKKRVAEQKEEVKRQTEEIFKSIKYSVPENKDDVPVRTYTAKLSIVGDILCNTDMLNDAKDEDEYYFDNMFKDIIEYTQNADYAIGTLETNFTNNDFSGIRKYNSPIAFLEAINKTGIDMVSVAHNHILDYGEEGFYETIDNIREQELSITGIANNEENENPEFTGNIKDIKGIKVAVLSYTYGISNERELSDEEIELANIYEVDKVDKDFEYAKSNSDFIIVIMHWGEINDTSISDWQLEVKDYLVSKGANAILRFPSICCRTSRIN